jgi:diacylglycerol kinase (ATP)
VPLEPLEALRLVLEGEGETWIDLIRVTDSDGRAILCVNHASGGIGGKIEEEMDADQKRRWKKLAYLRKAAEVVADPQGFDLRLKLDDQWLEPGRAMNIVIGNGRTAGGGFRVAPNADLADSYLDVVVAREAGVASMLGASARLLAGDYTKSAEVDQFRARHVRAETEMAFSVDGELFSRGTTEFRVLPRALRLAYAFERLRRTA